MDLVKSKKPNLNSWFKKQLFGFLSKFGRLKIERRNLHLEGPQLLPPNKTLKLPFGCFELQDLRLGIHGGHP